MASMGPAAFKRLVRAGHLVRFGQENNIDRLLEQLISGFGFFQRLVRINTCNPDDDGNKDRSENLGKAFSLFPNIAICHDTPLPVRLATLGAYYVRSGGKSLVAVLNRSESIRRPLGPMSESCQKRRRPSAPVGSACPYATLHRDVRFVPFL